MELHGLGIGEGQRERGYDATGGTHGLDEIDAFVALIGGLARPRSALDPLDARGRSSGRCGLRPYVRVPLSSRRPRIAGTPVSADDWIEIVRVAASRSLSFDRQ